MQLTTLSSRLLLTLSIWASIGTPAWGELCRPADYSTTGINYSFKSKKYSATEESKRLKALLKIDEEWKENDLNSDPLHPLTEALFKSVFQDDISGIEKHFDAKGCWSESLAAPQQKKGNEHPSVQHIRFFNELFALAYCYQFKPEQNPKLKGMQAKLYQNNDSKELIYKAINWYFTKATLPTPLYHDTFNYHEAHSTLAPAMCMLASILVEDIHKDKKSNRLAQAAYKNICNYAHQIIREQPQRRGANWAFRYDNCMLYVLFSRQPERMDEYRHYIDESLHFNEAQYDGIFPDWTMFHHGDLLYWGMYGTGWTERWVNTLGPVLQNSPWALSARELNFLQDALLDGVRHVIYRGNVDYTTASKRASLLLERTDHVAESFRDLCANLLQLGGKKLTRRKELQFLVNNTTPDMESYEQYIPSKYKEIAGNKHFWVSDYTNHRRNHYSISIMRQSLRTRGVADSDFAGHLHYGANYTSLLRRGDETRFSRFAWDFHNLPGTTVEQGRIIAAGRAGASTRRGMSLYSGHVSDGLFGAGANDQYIVDFSVDAKAKAGQENKIGRVVQRQVEGQDVLMNSLNGAGGLIAHFFLEDGMLALGCNIRNVEIEEDGFTKPMAPTQELEKDSIAAIEQGKILTTINNTLRRSEIVYCLDGGKRIHIAEGEEQLLHLSPKSQLWVWHDRIGYIITAQQGAAKAQHITLSAKPQALNKKLKEDKGFKKAIMQSPWKDDYQKGAFDMFTLYINHGERPQQAKYQYLVLMDKSVEELAQCAQSGHGLTVDHNDKALMAVHQGEELYYALFTQAGKANFGGGRSISVQVPLMVMIRKTQGQYHLSAFNPLHLGSRPEGLPGESPSVGLLYPKGVKIKLEGFSPQPKLLNIHFPDKGAFTDGASVHVDL